MNRKTNLIVLLLTAFYFSGCLGGESDTGEDLYTYDLQPTVSRDENPRVSDAEQQVFVESLNNFAFDLLRRQQVSGNTAISPYASALTLAKIYLGSGGFTKSEIETVLNPAMTPARFHTAFNRMNLSMEQRFSLLDGSYSSLAVNSRVNAQERYGFLTSYLNGLSRYYGVTPVGYDFDAQGLETRLTMYDSIRLSVGWGELIDENKTRYRWFTRQDGSAVLASMMTFEAGFNRYETGGFTAVELPLDDENMAMLVITPKQDNYFDFKASVNQEIINEILENLSPSNTAAFFPVFSSSTISSPLSTLGIKAAFTKDEADFSKIDGTMDLYFSDLESTADFQISEGGVYASGGSSAEIKDAHPETWAGYVILVESVNPVKHYLLPYDCSSERGTPFIFYLVDRGNGLILFAGEVNSPTEFDFSVTPNCEEGGINFVRIGTVDHIPVQALDSLMNELGPDFPGVDLSNHTMESVSFSGKNFSGASFAYSDIYDADMSNTTLNNADFSHAELRSTDLSDARCGSAVFTDADLSYSTMTNALLDRADFSNASLWGTDMSGVKAENAVFRGATFEYVAMINAISNYADFSGARIYFTDLAGIEAEGAIFTEAFILGQGTMKNAILRAADFSGAMVDNIDFSSADAENADFTDTTLADLSFSEANLSSANFSGATFFAVVDFSNANLTGADFSGAEIFENTNFSADLSFEGADLSNAIWFDGRVCGPDSIGECK